jgi:hypothetical protein
LLVKGDDPARGRPMPVPLVPAAPLARVALLGGFGNLGAAMKRLISSIREPTRATALLADQQSVDERGTRNVGSGSAGGSCAVAL